MASIHKELDLDVDLATVWDAVRAFDAPHALFVGVLSGTEVDGDERVVTFRSGFVVRERLVDVDDGARRIAYTVVGGPFSHHHASMSVHGTGDGRCRFEWTSDVLPHETAAMVGDLMDEGLDAMAVVLREQAALAHG
jgi:carbon monoxide dehydrogenase subunit G